MSSRVEVAPQPATAAVALGIAVVAGLALGFWWYWAVAIFWWVVLTPMWVGNVFLGGGLQDPPIHVVARIKLARQQGLFQ